MACEAEISAAEACIAADPTTCTCQPQPFRDNVPYEIDGAYKGTMAFHTPDEPEFCTKANDKVCTYLEGINCCCTAELTAVAACKFVNDLGPKLGAIGCEHKCGGGDDAGGAGGGGGSMMMIIIIAVVAIIILGCGGFIYRRRKRLQQEGSDKDKVSSFTCAIFRPYWF